MAAVVLGKPFRRKRSADSVLDGPGEAFTSEEVAEHCTEEDCYIVINGKVLLLITVTWRAGQTGSLFAKMHFSRPHNPTTERDSAASSLCHGPDVAPHCCLAPVRAAVDERYRSDPKPPT
jgi:hypothetical protein